MKTVYIPIDVKERLPNFFEPVFTIQMPNQPTMDGKPIKSVNKRIEIHKNSSLDKRTIERVKNNNDFMNGGQVLFWLEKSEINE